MNTRLTVRACAHVLFVTLTAIVAACGGGGYGGGGSGGGSCGGTYGGACPPPNTGAPTVTLNALSSTVSRDVVLTAVPTAPNGVMRVDFAVDGSVIGSATASPYTVTWSTGGVSDGQHGVTARVFDSQNQTASTSPSNVNVANNIQLAVTLSAGEEVPVPASTATGAGQLAVNLASGVVTGNFTLTGMTATAAHIHDAYAGNNGGILINFAAHPTIANRWDIPASTSLTTAQVDRLVGGALYVNAHSTAFAAGEIRGQLKPSNIRVIHAPMNGNQEVPAVATAAVGIAAVTVDSAASQATVHLNSTGVDDATMAHIHKGAAGANGAVFMNLTKDTTSAPARPGHWSAEKQAVATADITDFTNSGWYANIHTPAFPNGAIRGQIPVTAPATTLSQLQVTIFGPICSGCHSGGGATLPSSMNLSNAAASYAALVNVNSVEQNTVKRVNPNDVAGSYLVRKLEGDPSIGGQRMPLGGPFLSATTIDTVKSWINGGAQNN